MVVVTVTESPLSLTPLTLLLVTASSPFGCVVNGGDDEIALTSTTTASSEPTTVALSSSEDDRVASMKMGA